MASATIEARCSTDNCNTCDFSQFPGNTYGNGGAAAPGNGGAAAPGNSNAFRHGGALAAVLAGALYFLL